MQEKQNAIIWIQGKLCRPSEAKVSVYDRSYLYGDSLYEVVRTYHGQVYGMKDHLARLRATARLCSLDIAQSNKDIDSACQETIGAYQKQEGNPRADVYCRLVISRGEGKIGFGKNNLETKSLLTVIVQPIEEPSEAKRKEGAKLKIVERLRLDRRALEPAAKTGNYLNCLLAYIEAAEAGFDDALMCDEDGHVTEGTTFNLFYVKRGILVTPPLDIGILDGITRREVIELARGLGVPVRETRFPKERLYEADEVFLTGTIKEIMPVSNIDGRAIGAKTQTSPRPVTDRLWAEFRNRTRGASP